MPRSLHSLFHPFRRDLAVDLGNNTIRIFLRGKGLVFSEPNIAALRRRPGRVDEPAKLLAVGEAAKRMVGKTPIDAFVVKPMRGGVIADFGNAERILEHCVRSVIGKRPGLKPRVLICAPLGVTPVEKRAVRELALSVGAAGVHTIEEPLAAAKGARLPIDEPKASMIVEMGGGTTEIAVIALGGVVVSTSVRIGGDVLDEALAQYVRRRFNLLIGPVEAERAKIAVAAAHPTVEDRAHPISGLDAARGLPRTETLCTRDLDDALREPLGHIVSAVLSVLEACPPELAGDLLDRGVVLTGGGAGLRGVDALIADAVRLPVFVLDNPADAVIQGLGASFTELDSASPESVR